MRTFSNIKLAFDISKPHVTIYASRQKVTREIQNPKSWNLKPYILEA
jgi:hypothetical protein